MSDMPERIWVTQECSGFKPNFRRFHASSLEHGPDYPEYTRSGLVPTWNRDLSAAPAGKSVILATSGGYVGKAFSPIEPGRPWMWAATKRPVRHTPIAWQPLPRHPDEVPAAGSENGGDG